MLFIVIDRVDSFKKLSKNVGISGQAPTYYESDANIWAAKQSLKIKKVHNSLAAKHVVLLKRNEANYKVIKEEISNYMIKLLENDWRNYYLTFIFFSYNIVFTLQKESNKKC